MPRIPASHMLRSTMKTVSAPANSSFRGSLPHPTQQLCTLRVRHHCRLTQHSPPGGLLGLTWTRLAPADRASVLAPSRSGRDAIFIAPPAQNRTCGFPAYGSHLGCVTAKLPYTLQRLCHASLVQSPVRALLVRIPLGPRPSLHRLRCVRLRRCLRSGLPSLCSPASQLLWRGPTSRVRASSASAPHLPDADRPSHATPDGQTRDLPGSGAIPLHVMWP